MVNRLIWTQAEVERFWDAIAQTALDELSFSRLAGPALLAIVDPYLSPAGRHLDVGAGSGDLARMLGERGYRVGAWEPAPARRALIERNAASHDNFLGVFAEDSKDLFDVVLAVEVIEHILEPDLEGWIEWLAARITPGGTLILTTPREESLEHNMAYCPVSDMLFHRWQHQRTFSKSTLVDLLQRYGIDPIVVHDIEFGNPIFNADGGRWQSPEFRRMFAMGRSVSLGAGTTIVYVGRRRGGTAVTAGEHNWQSPVEIRAATELHLAKLDGHESFVQYRTSIEEGAASDIALVLPRLPFQPEGLQLDFSALGASVVLQPVSDTSLVGSIGMRAFGYAESLGTGLRLPAMPATAFVLGTIEECGPHLKHALFDAGVRRIVCGTSEKAPQVEIEINGSMHLLDSLERCLAVEGISDFALIQPRLPCDIGSLRSDFPENRAAVVLRPVQEPTPRGFSGSNVFGYNESLGHGLGLPPLPTSAVFLGSRDDCGPTLRRALADAGVRTLVFAHANRVSIGRMGSWRRRLRDRLRGRYPKYVFR